MSKPDSPAAKSAEPKTATTSPEDAAKGAEKPQPIVGTDNPEGIDLAKGDKDAATAYQED